MNLNFTMSELIYSETAVRNNINNMPDINSMDSLLILIVNVLQPIRELVKSPVSVSSGYRCEKVNTLVNGKSNSQHRKGEAADITVKGYTVKQLQELIKKSGIEVDQCINEYDKWLHVSYCKGRNRKQFFKV